MSKLIEMSNSMTNDQLLKVFVCDYSIFNKTDELQTEINLSTRTTYLRVCSKLGKPIIALRYQYIVPVFLVSNQPEFKVYTQPLETLIRNCLKPITLVDPIILQSFHDAY